MHGVGPVAGVEGEGGSPETGSGQDAQVAAALTSSSARAAALGDVDTSVEP